MRTTLNIDDEVLMAVQELAHRQRVPLGQIASRLLRQALTGQGMETSVSDTTSESLASTLGFQPFPVRQVVTNAQVNRLRDQEGL